MIRPTTYAPSSIGGDGNSMRDMMQGSQNMFGNTLLASRSDRLLLGSQNNIDLGGINSNNNNNNSNSNNNKIINFLKNSSVQLQQQLSIQNELKE